MEITSFILGVCAVIVVAMIVGTFVNYMAFKTLKQDFDNHVTSVGRIIDDIHRDKETIQQELHSRITETEQSLVRYIDSRVDKLDTKIYSDFDVKQKQRKQY
jgi:hypothetical protein